jgi:single-strand DNA-binding protein
MNKTIIVGRLTRDPEIRYSAGSAPMVIANFTLAVPRWNDEEADFIRCVAFGKKGEFAESYLFKGTKVILEGHIVTGKYEHKDGYTVHTTDVVADSIEFAESKKDEDSETSKQNHIRKGGNHYDKERTGSI